MVRQAALLQQLQRQHKGVARGGVLVQRVGQQAHYARVAAAGRECGQLGVKGTVEGGAGGGRCALEAQAHERNARAVQAPAVELGARGAAAKEGSGGEVVAGAREGGERQARERVQRVH